MAEGCLLPHLAFSAERQLLTPDQLNGETYPECSERQAVLRQLPGRLKRQSSRPAVLLARTARRREDLARQLLCA